MIIHPDTEYCDEVCARIAYTINAISAKVDMLPDTHTDKAKWEKEWDDFGKEYLQHIARSKDVSTAIEHFKTKHHDKIMEDKTKNPGKTAPEYMQKEGAPLIEKWYDLRTTEHVVLGLKARKLPHPKVPEDKPVEEPQMMGKKLSGEPVGYFTPCDDHCMEICNASNAFEAEMLALPDHHPQKSELMQWCLAFEAKMYKHTDERDEIGKKVFAARDEYSKEFVNDMSRMATGRMTSPERKKRSEESGGKMGYIEELWKKYEALGIDDKHKELQDEFDARPKIRSGLSELMSMAEEVD